MAKKVWTAEERAAGFKSELTKLWRYDPVTGYWKYVRDFYRERAKDWLRIFTGDEPGVHFKVSDNRPKAPPRVTKKNPASKVRRASRSERDANVALQASKPKSYFDHQEQATRKRAVKKNPPRKKGYVISAREQGSGYGVAIYKWSGMALSTTAAPAIFSSKGNAEACLTLLKYTFPAKLKGWKVWVTPA
jgi:hypothetical protein